MKVVNWKGVMMFTLVLDELVAGENADDEERLTARVKAEVGKVLPETYIKDILIHVNQTQVDAVLVI